MKTRTSIMLYMPFKSIRFLLSSPDILKNCPLSLNLHLPLHPMNQNIVSHYTALLQLLWGPQKSLLLHPIQWTCFSILMLFNLFVTFGNTGEVICFEILCLSDLWDAKLTSLWPHALSFVSLLFGTQFSTCPECPGLKFPPGTDWLFPFSEIAGWVISFIFIVQAIIHMLICIFPAVPDTLKWPFWLSLQKNPFYFDSCNA